jgi:hypothetical protein
MTFFKTIPEDEMDKARPEVFEAYRNLAKAVRSSMKLRRYELISFSASLAMQCSC